MSKYSKNYLPILFNIYMMDKRLEKDPQRQLVLDSVKSYLKISDNSLCNEFLLRAFKKYTDTYSNDEKATDKPTDENDLFMKYSLLDLISIMVVYGNDCNINSVYELAINGINVSNYYFC